MIKFEEGNALMVVIEGPDRLGKETQSKLLERALFPSKPPTGKWWSVKRVEVPFNDRVHPYFARGATYDEIYEMLRDGTARDFPVAFQALHAANRLHFQHNVLPNWPHDDVFIFDRWNLSTRVYGTCDGVPPEVTNRLLKNIMEPDITFVFDGDPFPKEGLDSYERDNEFQRRVRTLYRELSDADPTCVRIDANRDQDVIHAEILEHVRPLLPPGREPPERAIEKP